MPRKKTEGQNAAKRDIAAPTNKTRAPKAAATATARGRKTTAAIMVDYPLEGEIVMCNAYTFRVTALEPRSVEISLDGETWRPARESVGFWWYDWSGTESGTHTITARMKSTAGRTVESKPRRFTVLI